MTHGVPTTRVIDIRSALKPELNRAFSLTTDWHISQMKTHIIRQHIRVKHARDTGQPSELVDSMLRALEASLGAFERHRELIVSQLKRRISEYSSISR